MAILFTRRVRKNDPPAMGASCQEGWWLTPLADLFPALRSGADGLQSADASIRFKQWGPNIFRDEPKRVLLFEFLRRFRNPLVLILLAASFISALTGETASFVIITLMIILSVTIDFIQETRAARAADKLRLSVALRVSVLRDGARCEVPVANIVPGDVALISAGDLIPADGRLIEARDLFVKQALLTGEPYPVEKHAGDRGEESTDMLAAENAVFMGTSVVSGTASILVCRTGAQTAIGEIAETLETAPPPTSFEIGTRQFGLLIMRLTLFLVLFVLMVNTLSHKPLLESFLFAIALAVGLTPELLPMVISVTLSRGAMRMSHRHVIVKRLAAIENLGGMDVLCTDKTGTLTEAKIRLERHIDALGRDSQRVLQLAYINSFFETGLKSPLDDAILAHEEINVSPWKKIDEVPFDFERRRVSVLVENGASRLLVVKGAPEDILRLSEQYETDAENQASVVDAEMRSRLQAQCDALGREGFRVLGIAWKRVALDHPHAVVDDETELVFAGFAAFLDPPKASAGDAMAALTASGVAVKIVTGDNELVTQHICAQLGISIIGVLRGDELEQMGDTALRARVGQTNLFCRVNPAQKNRIILALKQRGHTVGYLGDGINDAPALHSADVGLSVEGAVDVAKEAADMILLRRDLKVLHDGVIIGRETFGNIRKYILMGTSSNFGNMFSMAGASLILPFLPMLPTQILLNNMLYDLSEAAIPLDRVDAGEVKQPQVWDMAFIRNFMWTIGPVSSLFDFLTFYILLVVLEANEALFQTGWFIESLATQTLVIFIIRTRGNPLANRPSPVLVTTSCAVVALAAWLPFSPLAAYFGFVAPPLKFFLILVGMVVVYLTLVEVVKHGFYKLYATRING
ncbi:MAG: magnesium-translocating P-type ATPase [Burkholderiales bacterium]